MTDGADVLARADAWQAALEARDVASDTAAVLQHVVPQATVAGEDRSGPFVLTDVWLRDADGAWRVWKRHSTPLSAGEMPDGMRG